MVRCSSKYLAYIRGSPIDKALTYIKIPVKPKMALFYVKKINISGYIVASAIYKPHTD